MTGGEKTDQCPFCNAPWGECSHVKLLSEWEEQALLRQARRELGAQSASSSAIPEDETGGKVADLLSRRSKGQA